MTQYHAKLPDEQGNISYTPLENQTWKTLYDRQFDIVQHRACDAYLDGISALHMPRDHIPQLSEINYYLEKLTGWNVVQVPALIGYDRFFNLLANRQFPAATFIRTPQELDYLQEPDIFHEIFGHCPMLTHPVYADFMQAYGKLGLMANAYQQKMLARVYWFTVEFGLLETPLGLRIYGGGILSSMGETPYALESPLPQRRHFHLIDALRTPYRIDIFQTVYYIIRNFEELYHVMQEDIFQAIAFGKSLGEFPPTYPAGTPPTKAHSPSPHK